MAFIAILFALSGCASQRATTPRKDLLDFLIDGSTKCSDLSDQLGIPGGTFEDGRLITYRIAEDGKRRLAVVTAVTLHAWTHSLVVTCGRDGVVTRHALVAVKLRTKEL
jgi:hypothetical protein